MIEVSPKNSTSFYLRIGLPIGEYSKGAHVGSAMGFYFRSSLKIHDPTMIIIGSVGIFAVRIAPNCGSPTDSTLVPPPGSKCVANG